MEETTETAVELAELRTRVAELERRNRELAAIAQKSASSAKTRPGWRAVLASVLIVVSVLLAPIAVLGSWASKNSICHLRPGLPFRCLKARLPRASGR